MNAGGAETFLMKVYRKLDKSRFQIDFCINTSDKCFYEDEILSMGGRIYRIPAKSQNPKAFSKQLGELVRNHKYQYVLRITSNAMGFMDLKIAKQAGAKICAARSSNSSDGAGWKSWVAHRLGRALFSKYVDMRFAPSDLAARYTFGNSAYEDGKVSILKNAVDLSIFHFDELGRVAIREELGVSPDALLIGHVGRFDTQKNHEFLLEVFREIAHRQPDAILLLVGKGGLEQPVREKAAALEIADKVIFAGVRSDVPQLLSAMDVFVFPSLYEGMPNTVIEAQSTGLPCVIADTITREADITGLVQYLPLAASPDIWAETVLASVCKQRKDTTQAFIEHHYDIQSTVREFVRLCFQE